MNPFSFTSKDDVIPNITLLYGAIKSVETQAISGSTKRFAAAASLVMAIR
jgi:hypothetical protein